MSLSLSLFLILKSFLVLFAVLPIPLPTETQHVGILDVELGAIFCQGFGVGGKPMIPDDKSLANHDQNLGLVFPVSYGGLAVKVVQRMADGFPSELMFNNTCCRESKIYSIFD